MIILFILLGIFVYLVITSITYIIVGLIQGKYTSNSDVVAREFISLVWPIGIPLCLLYAIVGSFMALLFIVLGKIEQFGDSVIKRIRGDKDD